MISRFFNKENTSIWLGPIFTIILTIILLVTNVYLGIFGVILSIVAAFTAWESYTNKDKIFKDYADNLDLYIEGFSKKAIFDMPFSVIMIDDRNNIIWYNSVFKNMIGRKDSMVDEDVREILPNLIENFVDDLDYQTFEYEYEQKDYEVNTTYLSKEQVRLLYFVDHTDQIDTMNKYQDEKMVLMNLRIDNIDELNSNLSSERRPILYAEIDTLITSYFHKYGSFIKKNETGKYIAITRNSSLQEMIEDKFSFVEELRIISADNNISPTLSIGIGLDEESPRMNEKSANAALDIALGRGGDQVVMKSGDKLEYFGGKNQATEKRTRVKARVIAHALAQYVDKATEIFISGHVNPDMDSLGSAIGIWHACKQKGKKAYIVLSQVTPAITNIYEYTTENIEDLKESIISPEDAYNRIKASSLLIVTDNHRKNSTEEPRLFEKTSSVVIIDHHRRGADYIENATLTYLEPSASSASELVTEMLMYMDEKLKIKKEVAEALLAGIMMDTKNFTQQTGSRTFEAATNLKQNGADSNIVNKLFVEDFTSIKSRSEIISSAEIYKDIFVIGIFDKDLEDSSLIASQAADELIAISNIEASFVLTKQNGRTHISARSNENISVQLIMEKLNGGGHRNMAATQLDVSIDEAKALLKKAISEYLEEDDQ